MIVELIRIQPYRKGNEDNERICQSYEIFYIGTGESTLLKMNDLDEEFKIKDVTEVSIMENKLFVKTKEYNYTFSIL